MFQTSIKTLSINLSRVLLSASLISSPFLYSKRLDIFNFATARTLLSISALNVSLELPNSSSPNVRRLRSPFLSDTSEKAAFLMNIFHKWMRRLAFNTKRSSSGIESAKIIFLLPVSSSNNGLLTKNFEKHLKHYHWKTALKRIFRDVK